MDDLQLDGLPSVRSPLAKKRDPRPRITVAASPCLVAEVEYAAARNNISTMEWCRNAWQAAIDGYPDTLTATGHTWLERQAREMGVDWSEALARLVDEVARRYPRGVRLP